MIVKVCMQLCVTNKCDYAIAINRFRTGETIWNQNLVNSDIIVDKFIRWLLHISSAHKYHLQK